MMKRSSHPFKDVPPTDRMTQSTYTGDSFDMLDIHPLSDGGRLLMAKQTYTGIKYGLHASFDRRGRDLDPKTPDREVLRLFPEGDMDGALGAVEAIMTRLVGVSVQDAGLITAQARARYAAPTIIPVT
jgi:hypothetical protein